jgi:hypothetical protein
MAEARQTGPGLLGNNWILLAVVTCGAIYASFHVPPLTGSRPAGVQLDLHDHRGSQQVDARLWQDPLAATVEHAKVDEKEQVHKKDPRAHSIVEFTEDLRERTPLIIGVTMPGAPYTEDSELRRRFRYATVAALKVTGYAPEDSQHLGYIKPNNIVADRRQTDDGILAISKANVKQYGAYGQESDYALRSGEELELPVPTVIPFEWYKIRNAKDSNKKWVVVLWIDESMLGSKGHPLWTLVSLLRKFESEGCLDTKIAFALIGPQASGTLHNMISDISDYYKQPQWFRPSMSSLFKNFFIYNFGATASLPFEQNFGLKNINYYRSISTDGELAKVLVKELKLRGVDPYKERV